MWSEKQFSDLSDFLWLWSNEWQKVFKMGTNIYEAPKYWIYRGQALPGARCDEDHLIEEETKAQESEKPAQVYKVGRNRELRPSSQGRKCRGPDFRPDVNHLYAHVFYTSAHILSSLSGTLWNLKFPLSHQPCFYKAIYTSTISTPPSTCQVLLTPWDPKCCLLSSLPSATHLLLLSLLHPQDYSS